ncbi:MAG: putative metal-binding motif-containing protein [Pyrinomonadaceae bacterium]
MPQISRATGTQELVTKAGDNDFLFPGQGFANRKATTANASKQKSLTSNIGSSGFPVESIVQYQSFAFGTSFTLHAFTGKYVSYLLPESQIGVNGLSRDEIRELVDLTDLIYAHMMEIVGGEPLGNGPLTIALINPGYDFGAKGWVGKKGVEMYEGYAVRYRSDFLAGCVPVPVVHEMSHNFDIYNAYINHDGGDNVHGWTAFLIPYSQYYAQSSGSWRGRVVQPQVLLDQTIEAYLNAWRWAGTSASWNSCVKSGTGCEDREIYANQVWGGILLSYARLHSPSAVRRAFRFISDYKATHSTPPATAEAKNDVLVSALAAGAEANVACELNAWNWPVSAEAAAQMTAAYPNQNSFCSDADNDGYTPATGDHDDFNSTIRPGASEAVNILDDDCNGIVDDLTLNEVEDVPADAQSASRVTIPGHLIGHTATAADSDSYQIEIDRPRSINIWARGIGKTFSGWFELRCASDPDTTEPVYLSYDFPAGTVIQFERAGTWILTVMPWSGANEGYEVLFSEIDPTPQPLLRTIANRKSGLVLIEVTTDKSSFNGLLPTKVRLWAEGTGFVAEQPFQRLTTFKLNLPSRESTRIRAQLLYEDFPLSSPTKSVSAGILYKPFLQKLTVGRENHVISVTAGSKSEPRMQISAQNQKLRLTSKAAELTLRNVSE